MANTKFWQRVGRSLGRAGMALVAVTLLLAAFVPTSAWKPLLGTTSRADVETITQKGEPLRALIVGGGPDLENNQVAIESNVRYVGRLLPPGTPVTRLFTDGNPNHATVLYDYAEPGPPSLGRRIVEILLDERNEGPQGRYRKPNLGGACDGSSSRAAIERAFNGLAHDSETSEPDGTPRPVLLFFTGHGSSDNGNHDNNVYDLWNEEELSVRDLAGQIARLPHQVPVTIVMVQCFSGAFGNLLYADGNPKAAPLERDIAGFFATTQDRYAAGCTSEVNEAEYHDFTSYFFAALTGRDRVGRKVGGADYNKDGRVGMNEAFCYTLSHDKSIDVPVCTSDVFLRRYATLSDAQVFATPWQQVRAWANPAQGAALDELARELNLAGESRLQTANRRLNGKEALAPAEVLRLARAYESGALENRLMMAREKGRERLFRAFPRLRSPRARGNAAIQSAATQITSQAQSGVWKQILEADSALSEGEIADEALENKRSYLLRFLRLAKSVVLAHHLNQNATEAVKARFDKLLTSEDRSLLPHAM